MKVVESHAFPSFSQVMQKRAAEETQANEARRQQDSAKATAESKFHFPESYNELGHYVGQLINVKV